ncbi:MAG: hypothetical protein K2M73_08050 [Lachnospiraceae bacterium]|nr:hypothetical protein [Lachnospiraceae bacterium]
MTTTNNDDKIEKLCELAQELGAKESDIEEFLSKFTIEEKQVSFESRYENALKDAKTIDEIYKCGYVILAIMEEELKVCKRPLDLEWFKGIVEWFNMYSEAVSEYCLDKNVDFYEGKRTKNDYDIKDYILRACMNEHREVFRSIMLHVLKYLGRIDMIGDIKGLDTHYVFDKLKKRYENVNALSITDVLYYIFCKENYERYIKQ